MYNRALHGEIGAYCMMECTFEMAITGFILEMDWNQKLPSIIMLMWNLFPEFPQRRRRAAR